MVGFGGTTAVENEMGVALMSGTIGELRTIAADIVLLLKFAAWTVPVATPVGTVTSHVRYAGITLVATVSVSVAVEVPEFVPVAVKVLLPHPLILGVPRVPNVKVGNIRSMLSDTPCKLGSTSKGRLCEKMYEIEDGASETGFEMIKWLNRISEDGMSTTGVLKMVMAAISVADCRPADTFR